MEHSLAEVIPQEGAPGLRRRLTRAHQASCGAVWAWAADDPSNNVTNYRTISYSCVPANVEIAAFFRVWPLTLPQDGASLANMSSSTYGAEYDGVVKTMQFYIDGCKQGKSGLMRLAFHGNAGFFGYVGGELAQGTPFLFDWVDKNGPSPHIRPRFVSVDILESIAAVRLEVDGWSGILAGPEVCMSDIFTLLKTAEGWKIIQKAFHWRS